MTGEELYGVFKGMRLHFTSPKYNYLKYGPSKVSQAEFGKVFVLANALTRKFKTRDALETRLVSVFKNRKVWLNEICSPESEKMEREHTKVTSSFMYHFSCDLDLLSRNNDDMMVNFIVDNAFDLPPVAKQMISGKISLETFCVMDYLLNFSPKINDLVWKGDRLRVEKYKAFFKPDMRELAVKAREYFK